MIKCDGIKAFHGTATIRPKNPDIKPFEISGDWVYRSENGCWYCGGRSFMEGIVTDIQEEMMASDLIGEMEARLGAMKRLAVTAENVSEIAAMIENVEEWLVGVKTRGAG